MPAFAALPWVLQLTIVFAAGALLGALVNLATYRLAWFNPREISPWGPAPSNAPPRSWLDRIPIIGWRGLRREHAIHGRGFWIRPLLIELSMAIGLAALYWWEVHDEQLIRPQIVDWLRLPLLPLANVVPVSWTHATFLNHALLIALMAAASFIDIDEKIIPDSITIPGTLLGLTLATLLPIGLLPHVHIRAAAQPINAPVNLPDVAKDQINPQRDMYVEPVTFASPNTWPEISPLHSLLLGQACWWFWCFALTNRIYRGRRGVCRALNILLRRVLRDLTRTQLAPIAWLGSVAVAGVWWWGGPAWVGLFTSLVGLVGSGGIVWAVRKVGTWALNREAMGFGDVTLMMMVGTFLGWQAGVMIFFIAPFAGMIVGIAQLILNSDDVIPYGPFLCLGALIVMVQWATIWNATQFVFQAGIGVVPPGWLVPSALVVVVVLLGLMLAVWQRIKTAMFSGGEDEDE